MKFNQVELGHYAASRLGKSDKAGTMWMKEGERTTARKKEAHTQRWFILIGNLLFYTRSEEPDSVISGLIILERCRVESDLESTCRNSFKLSFEGGGEVYWFMTATAKDHDEWTTAISCGGYEYLRMAFSELRGQLVQLTGEDPLIEDHPLGGIPIKHISHIPTVSAPGFDGEPVFELSLACSSLRSNNDREADPSTLVVTNCMTPPQAYWLRYAQSEVIEHNCNPHFFTTVVFYPGVVSMVTKLKFEVFDVYDCVELKMSPIGLAHCSVMELVTAPNQFLQLEIKSEDDVVCGCLHVQVSRSVDSPVPSPRSKLGDKNNHTESQPTKMHFTYRAPMANILVRTYQFPVWQSTSLLKVTEVMGEGLYSFLLPMQMLDIFIAEELTTKEWFESLTRLKEDWEIIKQEVLVELAGLVSRYHDNHQKMEEVMELGLNFKKSIDKTKVNLEFAPVNLHIQEMKVAEERDSKEKLVFTAVTVGCPSAYTFKYRQGGLARLHVSPAYGDFRPSSQNKSYRAKQILMQIDTVSKNVHKQVDRLKLSVKASSVQDIQSSVRCVADLVHQLSSHCNVALLNDSLQEWNKALEIPTALPAISELNAGALCYRVKEHVLCLEAHVEAFTHSFTSIDPGATLAQLEKPLNDLLTSLEITLDLLRKALFFLLLKENHHQMQTKVPIGIKSYRHRRDVVFSQAVTSAATCFMFKVLQSVAVSSFLNQLLEVGFLIHWESLLSTHGDEIGMLEDFIVAIRDLNYLQFKLVCSENIGDSPRIKGHRYKMVVEVPVQQTFFRVLPTQLRDGRLVKTRAVLFTQGINEQQSLADTIGDSSLQDSINTKSLQELRQYCSRFRELFGTANARLVDKTRRVFSLLEQLHMQVHSRKAKNTDILSLSQELCRQLNCGRITSCKSAKDRTAMSITLEQAHILTREMNMDNTCFQHALDSMRSRGTRLRNAEKNVGSPLYAFNALQVHTLPKHYRPPEGTFKKLQT